MNPDENKTDPYTETPEEPTTVNSPWHSSQGEPVVHTVTTPQPELTQPPKPKRTFGQKLKALLRSPKFWLTFVALLIVTGIALWFIEPTRLWLVNAFGARNTITITTITPGEGKAKVSQLKNVAVTVNGVTYHTDSKGKLQIPNVPYGTATITAKKAGFQDVSYGVSLDFDPFLHKFGGKSTDDAARNVTLSMKGVGIPVSFKLTDWLSGKPVTVGDFTVGDVVAKPDDQGLVSLRVPGTDATKVTVGASFGGAYVDKTFDVTLGSAQVPVVQLVPGGKHYFLSNRSGATTLYSANLDGTDVQPIVTGTGKETDATTFAVSPDGKYGVLSSSRDGAQNAKHDTLQRVYVVDLATKQITRVDEGVNVSFADWSGDELIYTTTGFAADTNTYTRTLRGVDVSDKRVYNFETADDIAVATVASGKVLYVRYTSTGPDKTSSPLLRVAPVNATTSKTLGDQVNYSADYYQLDYNRVTFKTTQDQAWHEYAIGNDQLKTVAIPSASDNTLRYLGTTSSDGGKYLYVDRVDGKYTLLLRQGTETTTLYGADGLSGPIRWINDDTITYRVTTPSGTSDYVVSLKGGQAKKITDATPSMATKVPYDDPHPVFY
jgi:hypothetical protein